MRDELFDRDFQQARAGLNDGIDRGVAAIRLALAEQLHRLSLAIRPSPPASAERGC